MATLEPNNGNTTSLASAALARRAREIFVQHAATILGEVAVGVRSKLNELVDKASNAKDSQERRDTWLAYQKGEAVWVGGITAAWKSGILATNAPVSTGRPRLSTDSFELMGNDVMDNKILSSRLALRILDKSSWEFNDLILRVRQLENLPEIDKLDIVRPEAFAQLVTDQWMAAGLSREGWLAVQATIHQAFGEKMTEAYHAANEFLIANGIMAEIDLRPMVKRTPGSSSAAPLSQSGNLQPAADAAGNTLNQGQHNRGAAASGGASRAASGGGSSQAYAAGAGAGAGAGANHNAGGSNGSNGSGGGNGGYGGNGGGGFGTSSPQAGPSLQRGGSAGASGYSSGAARTDPAVAANRAAAARYAPDAHEETRMMTAATPLARAKMRAQGVIGQLKRLLSDKVAGFDDTRSNSGPSPQLAAAMRPRPPGYEQTQVAAYTGNGAGSFAGGAGSGAGSAGYVQFAEGMRPEQVAGALREQTATLKKAASTTAEKATIEIVALMFQSILAEDRIPAAVRVWFARLQMPVLRLALAEPEFFGSLQHPARRLIDRMGSCVLGFEATVSSAALEVEIKRVVQVIEQYPETGRRVFQLVYDEFAKFLSKFLSEQSNTQRIVSVAQQVEQKETAAIQYTIEMRKMLGDMPVRDEIREYLFKVWTEVMAVSSIKNGPLHAETQALRQVAADLVWAASAKPNRNDRAKVIQDLPSLLKRLRAGMGSLGFDLARQDGQIKIISDTLADAFMSKTDTIDPQQIADMAKRLKNLEDYVSDDDVGDLPLDAESIELMLGIDVTGIDIITAGGSEPTEAMRGWAKELDLGSWFNLDHNGKVGRIQYAWTSKRGQLHLFAGANGRTYLFQIRRLASYLQAGLITPIEDESLTVRATRDALTKLDANPERLLAV